jgi:hypothetical protein
LKHRSAQDEDDFSTWEIAAVASGTDGGDVDTVEQTFELLRYIGEKVEVLEKAITKSTAGSKNWGVPIKAEAEVICCVWLEPKDRSAPCR